ncbi:MAG TPA: hypothetical protein VMS22_21020 [Candidatus Eisenbacteria bacterium]|nr:hypothetical protein [Candidatus Eisenbacteria bacterium]
MYRMKIPRPCEMPGGLMNPATPAMAQNMARNLVYYAQLLKKHPLAAQEGA